MMNYRAVLHFPEDPQQQESIYREIADCRLRYVKRYIESQNFNSKQAEVLKEHIQTIFTEKSTQLRKVS